MYRPPLTLGVEEEYMLVDAKTLALSPGAQEMLAVSEPLPVMLPVDAMVSACPLKFN